MFKFDADSPETGTPRTLVPGSPVSQPTPSYRALLAWGEHCVECAAPACYTTCDLYKPTRAGKCRRFEDGIVRNRTMAMQGVEAAEVRFRRWGKLEAQGNAKLLPSSRVRLLEEFLSGITPSVEWIGNGLARVTGDSRWSTAMDALHKRLNNWLVGHQSPNLLPKTFIAEISNPSDSVIELTLIMTVDRRRLSREIRADQLPAPFSSLIPATPGFSRTEIDVRTMHPIVLSGLPFNISVVPVGDATPHLIFHSLELTAVESTPLASQDVDTPRIQTPAKCVVFDLDNTLWDGVLLEGEVTLRHGILSLFEALDERGILISVASKNAREDAILKLKQFGLDELILHPRIGWAPKSESLKQVAKAIDIGVDSLIFVDDSSFERAEVSSALPHVEVIPDTAIKMLLAHPRLQGAVTEESRQRRQMYKAAIAREEVADSFGDDYEEFLRTCQIRVEIRPEVPSDLERIVELVQRTNQLNFSGRKYARAEISQVLADSGIHKHVIRVTDKFGSYGIVGFCLSTFKNGRVSIQDFMLSCRVQGKFIEQALFHYLANTQSDPAAEIWINFNRTARNRAAEMVIEKLGFLPAANGGLLRQLEPRTFELNFLQVEGAR